MLEGFRTDRVAVGDLSLHVRTGGDGPPLLLLHGYPQTGAMWHRVAPALAETHTVVVPDLRGYGASDKPVGSSDHATYGKRAMAADQAALMTALGHERFAVVGHDRGARVTHRLLLDYPDRVTRAALLDIAPTRHVFADVDKVVALTYDHWFFLAQPTDLPEVLIGGAPEHWLRTKLAQWSGPGAFDEVFVPEAVAEYVAGFDPAGIHGSTEDYRAGASVDLVDDEESWTAGVRIACPLLVLWGAEGLVGRRYDTLAVWRDYAERDDLVQGGPIPGGHFLPEEAPEETLAALRGFLG